MTGILHDNDNYLCILVRKEIRCCVDHESQRMALITGEGYACVLALHNAHHWKFQHDWFVAHTRRENSVEFFPDVTGIVFNFLRDIRTNFPYLKWISIQAFNLIPVTDQRSGDKARGYRHTLLNNLRTIFQSVMLSQACR